MVDLPTLGLVVLSALIDSINPCAIGIFILIVSVILGSGKSTKRLLLLGGAYIFAIFTTYLAAGLGLIYVFSELPIVVVEYLTIAISLMVIVAGVLEIKDYFWYGKGPSLHIPKRSTRKIQKMSSHATAIISVVLLGIFVAAIELPCTGAPYLAIITILRTDFNTTTLLTMVLYNLLFVVPLIIILIMVATGTKTAAIVSWKEDNKAAMRLMTGLLLAALGWILILIANGTINFA